MTDRRRVRLMSDYGVGWPLWDAAGAMDPAVFELSEGLTARLHAWQDSRHTPTRPGRCHPPGHEMTAAMAGSASNRT